MKILALLLLLIPAKLIALNDPYPPNTSIDIKHYTFQLELNDTTDLIAGDATVTVSFLRSIRDFELDLTSKKPQGDGMQVKEVLQNGKALKFSHEHDRLKINLLTPAQPGDQLNFIIRYSGIPKDGLIISKNKFGDRTFFGDNWPDRGHQWLPVIDHPSDKARVDFIIIAPEHYQVVATGRKIEESNMSKHRKLTHWEELVDVPVKVMTIGVARFSIQQSGEVDHIPVSTWVFPQNRDEGFIDFEVASKIMYFFQEHIGPFSYEKMAHVQSKTRWGGLENASNIFYFENSVNGKNEREELIAHETAHQWFGNSVSENDWHHVWLSEGFATYFTNLYMEYAHGHDKLIELAKEQRQAVIKYLQKNSKPVVDTTITEIEKVLSTNTYQKAGWVLHMLRYEVGDALFWAGIQKYYRAYQNSNALTNDFQTLMEEASGKDLDRFFDQWIYKGGHPVLDGSWAFNPKTKTLQLSVDQIQNGQIFTTPLEIGIYYEKQDMPHIEKVWLDKKSNKFNIPCGSKPLKIALDPATNLLFEGKLRN